MTVPKMRRVVGGLLAAALAASLGVLVAPAAPSANASAYPAFEIENYTWATLSLSIFDVPPGGWVTPPPQTIGMGERRHFSVATDRTATGDLWMFYTPKNPYGGGGNGVVQIRVHFTPAGAFPECVASYSPYECTVVPSVNGSNPKFVIDNYSDTDPFPISAAKDPTVWAGFLSLLCARVSLATCLGPNFGPPDPYGNWQIVLGKRTFNLGFVDWAGANGEFAAGTRGNPYQQVVGTPAAFKPFGFTTQVAGLPPGLTYNAQYDQITGWLSSPPGNYPVTIILKSGTTVLATGSRTIRILAPPPVPQILTTTFATTTVGVPTNQNISVDVPANGTEPTVTVTGLPAGLTFNRVQRVITGTPTTAGTYPVVITATNSAGIAAKTISLVVKPK